MDEENCSVEFHVISNNVDEFAPLLYLWEIRDRSTGEVIGRYVGKATKGSKRPRKHYARNVRRLLGDKPYRNGKPDAFRAVHVAMAQAVREGHKIILTLLRNIPVDDDIDQAEREAIAHYGCNLNR